MSNYNAAPGWYPDGQGNQRYWDGAAWSEHVTPMYPGGAAAQAPVPVKPEPLTIENVSAESETVSTIEGADSKVSISDKRVVISEASGELTVLARSEVKAVSAQPTNQGVYMVTVSASVLTKTITVSSKDDALTLVGLVAN